MQCRFVTPPPVFSPEGKPFSAALRTALTQRRLVNHYFLLALLFLVIPFNQVHADAPQSPAKNDVIYFGLLPYLSSAALIKTWQPLADYIAKILHKKVIIKTAPDFNTFFKRTKAGRYHILMTAPHFAAYAVKNHGYRIIAEHNNDLVGDIIVAKNSELQSINDLRGKTLAVPGRLAVVSTLAELLLQENGLIPNKDVNIKISPAHNTALIAVAEGKVDAAVAVGGLYRRINASKKFAQLRKLTSTNKIPHVMYIASPALSDADFRLLQQALTQPIPDSEGATVLADLRKLYNWGPIVMPSQKNLDRLKPVLSILEALNI